MRRWLMPGPVLAGLLLWACHGHGPAKQQRPQAPTPAAPDAALATAAPPAPDLRHDCQAGDGAACLGLGEAYLAMRRLAEAPKLADAQRHAAAAFDRACQAGVMRGCALLARLAERGTGVPEDRARATALAEKACAAGDLMGCYVRGGLWETDPEHLADGQPKALELYQRACDGDAGLPDACLELGLVYHGGRGVPKDPARAKQLFEQACAGGDATACRLRRNLDRPR